MNCVFFTQLIFLSFSFSFSIKINFHACNSFNCIIGVT